MSPARGTEPPSAWVLVAACAGYAMVILDTTVVNVALPSISHALRTTTTGLEWVLDGYSLSFAVFLLSAGALSDRRGAKEVFLQFSAPMCDVSHSPPRFSSIMP